MSHFLTSSEVHQRHCEIAMQQSPYCMANGDDVKRMLLAKGFQRGDYSVDQGSGLFIIFQQGERKIQIWSSDFEDYFVFPKPERKRELERQFFGLIPSEPIW